MIENILVVCVGNICRSPMAEALLRQAMLDVGPVTVSSAGLRALVDHPAAEHARDLIAERGLDLSGHVTRQITPDLIYASDLILVMESRHKSAIEDRAASARGRVYRLCEQHDMDIPDPYRQSRDVFEEALLLIDQGVEHWAEKIRLYESGSSRPKS